MDRHQVRWALLKISLLVLLGTTWVFWSFVLSTRPEQSADALSKLARLPASLPARIPGLSAIPALQQSLPEEVAAPSVMESIAMDTIRIPCWDKDEGVQESTDARWVRLTGKSCDDAREDGEITVRNLTNGYDATVFPTRPAMTTDYIPLQAGKNEILIRYSADQGAAKETRVQFLRR